MQIDKRKYRLCKNCHNCKCKNGKIYCKEGFFQDKNDKDIQTYIPEIFECFYYNE